MKNLKKPILIGLVGNILEWYDFSLFIYLSVIIAKLFFPANDPGVALINTFGIFAAGFLIRPLGSILFGYIGDRFGRKQAMYLSILIISIPTTLIAFLPTYDSIGIYAPLLLAFLRILQGLSVGGEFPSSMLYLTEHAPKERRGFAGSFAFFGSAAGWLLGSFSASIATSYLTEQQMLSYGWRILFSLGILTAIWGIFIRSQASETSEFESIKSKNQLTSNPLSEVVTNRFGMLSALVGLNFLPNIAGYLLFAYMPTYLHKVSGIDFSLALLINSGALLFNMLLVPLVGHLSDRIGRFPLHITSAVGFILLSYPLFGLFSSGSIPLILVGMGVGTILITLYNAPIPATMSELFPSRVRTTGVAVGYTAAACAFGGTCPLIASYLVEKTGNAMVPVYYLIASAIVTLFVAVWVYRTQKSSLYSSVHQSPLTSESQ